MPSVVVIIRHSQFPVPYIAYLNMDVFFSTYCQWINLLILNYVFFHTKNRGTFHLFSIKFSKFCVCRYTFFVVFQQSSKQTYISAILSSSWHCHINLLKFFKILQVLAHAICSPHIKDNMI